MKIFFHHIAGKMTDMSLIYCNVYAQVEPEEETKALEEGWAIDEWAQKSPRYWFQGRQTRIDVSTLKYNRKTRRIIKRCPDVTCEVKKIGNTMTLISKFDNNFFSNKNNIDHLILEYKDDQVWFSETKKLSNKDYIAQIKSIEEETFLLDKSKIKYTIITKSGGFQKKGCKSN